MYSSRSLAVNEPWSHEITAVDTGPDGDSLCAGSGESETKTVDALGNGDADGK